MELSMGVAILYIIFVGTFIGAVIFGISFYMRKSKTENAKLSKLIEPEASYWDKRSAKIATLLVFFMLAFINVAAKHPLLILGLLWFPAGLFYRLVGNLYNFGHVILGWLLYLSLSIAFIRSKNKLLNIILLVILTGLLIVNVQGCQVQGSDYWGL